MRARLLASALGVFLSAATHANGDGVCIYAPTGFMYEGDYCNCCVPPVHTWESVAETALGGYYGTPDTEIVAKVQRSVTDIGANHATVDWLMNNMPQKKLLVIASEGVSTGGFEIESYTTEAIRNTRYFHLLDEHGFQADELFRRNNPPDSPPRFVLGIKPPGISAHLRPLATPEFILLGLYCYSSATEAAWLESSPDASMIAYPLVTWSDATATLFGDAMATLSCWYGLGPFLNLNDVSQIPLGGLAELAGWPDNQYWPGWGCGNPAGVWYHTSAYNGTIRMAYTSEDSASSYFVLADGDTVASFSGRGSDGYGELRCYTTPAPTSYSWFTCVEVDSRGWETYSTPFTWQNDSGDWEDIVALDGMTMDEIREIESPVTPDDPWAPDDPRWDWVAGHDAWLAGQSQEWVDYGDYRQLVIGPMDDCPLCADVVAYAVEGGPVDPPTYLSTLFQQDFSQKKVVLISGSDDPLDVRSVLSDVAAANAAQGGGQYPDNPTLLIVGADWYGGVVPMGYPDNVAESCREPTCRSFSLIGDIRGEDNLPDCPVQVVPARTQDELATLCAYAHEWNQGTNVNPDGTGLFLLDDVYNGLPNDAMSPIMYDIRDMYSATNGLTAGPLMKWSDYYPLHTPWESAVQQAFRQGVRDVWSFGYHGSPWTLPFLNADVLFTGTGLDSNQVIMCLAPTCNSARTSGNWQIWRELLVLADPDETRAAGFLGQLNAAYDTQHAAFARVLRNELGNAPPGTTFDIITHNAVLTMAEQDLHYALGVTWRGAYTRMRGTFLPSTGVREEPDGVDGLHNSLWASLGGGSADLHFSLDEDAAVKLNIYDVGGRLVAKIKNGHVRRGKYTYTWFMQDARNRPVSSGVYFARLEIGESGSDVHTARIVVTK